MQRPILFSVSLEQLGLCDIDRNPFSDSQFMTQPHTSTEGMASAGSPSTHLYHTVRAQQISSSISMTDSFHGDEDYLKNFSRGSLYFDLNEDKGQLYTREHTKVSEEEEQPQNAEITKNVEKVIRQSVNVVEQLEAGQPEPSPVCSEETYSEPSAHSHMDELSSECHNQYPRSMNCRSMQMEQQQIDLDRVVADGRTTLMVRNIPNKYTNEMLLDLFNMDFKRKFDYFYLPIDKQSKCNVGYAFINFIDTKFVIEFYNMFQKKGWKHYNSEKKCNICYAYLQGPYRLRSHYQDAPASFSPL